MAMSLSKKDWLSIAVNKERYEKHLVDHQPYPSGYWEAEPAHHAWKGKTCTNWKGQSKREWVASLKENNNTEYTDNNGTDERRIQEEAIGEVEGGAGESKKDA